MGAYAHFLFDDSLSSEIGGFSFTITEGKEAIFSEGKFKKAISLSDYYQLTLEQMEVFLNHDFTVLLWFNANKSGLSKYPNYRRIIWAKAANYRGIELDSKGRVALVTEDKTVTTKTYYNDNKWHFLVWKHINKEHTVQIDDEIITNTCTENFGSQLYLSQNSYSMNGQIDNLFLFNYILNDEEIRSVKDGTYVDYIRRFLIRDLKGNFYTIVDGALTALETTELTAQDMLTHGLDAVPSYDLISSLEAPAVLCWQDTIGHPVMTAGITAVPYNQTIYTDDYDMIHESIVGIENVVVDADETTLFAISFDSGVTWRAYDGTIWVTLSEEQSGMTKTTLESIGVDAWAEVAVTGKYRFRFVLLESGWVKSIKVNYLNREENT